MTVEPKPNSTEVSPEQILQMDFSPALSRVLHTGVQLAVFTHIAAGHHTVEEIARAAGASQRGMRMLLDVLVSFQLLAKTNSSYQLSPLAAEFLVRGKPDYIGAIMENDRMWESWGHLTEVVRSGEPIERIESQQAAENFFPILVRSLHVLNRRPARRTAEILLADRTEKGLKVLDIACGSGIWGIAIAEADPSAQITAQDFPGMLDVTREYLRQHGVENRYDFLPGDLKQVDLGTDRFDLALLGNIVHSEGEASSRDLFARLYRALRPEGRIVIIDMVPNDERTNPAFPLVFALNMLLHTKEGDTYTLAEYRQWLNNAGFKRVETANIGSHSPLIIGFK
ncbi:MAG: class I SAM-dependent methyltransferase [Acidobacteriota bacterium]